MTLYHLDFEPIGRRGDCSAEQSLLDCARQLAVEFVSICGGAGSCERCKFQVVSGQVSELTNDEKNNLTQRELEQGYRLACQTFPQSDVKLHVPPDSLSAPQRTQGEGLEVAFNLIHSFAVSMRNLLHQRFTLQYSMMWRCGKRWRINITFNLGRLIITCYKHSRNDCAI